jgi:DNA-binding NarL/FixJ family response regulator
MRIRIALLARGLARAGIEGLLPDGVELVDKPEEAELLIAVVEDGELPARLVGEQMPPLMVLTDQPRRDWLFGEPAARAVLPQGVQPHELLAAIQAVQAGLSVIHPSMLIESAPSEQQPSILTPREIEVLRRVAEGAPNKIIAHELGISDHTVKFHVAQILSKLQAGSRTEAVTAGLRLGIVHL